MRKYTKTVKRHPIFVIGPSIAYIPLTRGQYSLVEWDDAENLGQWNWYAAANLAAARGQNKSTMYMHRQILSAPDELIVDHRNLNRLDNRKHGNLRSATVGQNNCNQNKRRTSAAPYKGIGAGRNGQWIARIKVKGKLLHLGVFATPEEAHAVFCSAASLHHREFARFE